MRVTRERWIRIGLATGTAAAVVVGGYAITWLVQPRPEATLRAADGPASAVARLLGVDASSLTSYESFRGVRPWSALDSFGNPCLFLIEHSTLLWEECVPREGELMADIGAWPALAPDFAAGLPDGSVIRFHYRGNTVDVFVHRADPPRRTGP